MADENLETANQDETVEGKKCFVIMPISDPDGYDKGHFKKVYEDIICVGCKNAGFEADRADNSKESNLIHLDILRKLIDSPLVICDLSSRNPNVLFELGIRQAFDKPTVLIQEAGTPQIFDIAGIRTITYSKELKYRDVLVSQNEIKDVILATMSASTGVKNGNSIIDLLAISKATVKEVSEGNANATYMQLIMQEIINIRNDMRNSNERRTILRSKDDFKNIETNNYFLRDFLNAKNRLFEAINEDLGESEVQRRYEALESSAAGYEVFTVGDENAELVQNGVKEAKIAWGAYSSKKYVQSKKASRNLGTL